MGFMEASFETRLISSLEKVFPDEELRAERRDRASALKGETFSFQVAYRSDLAVAVLAVRVASALAGRTTVRAVGLAPSDLPCYDEHDEDVLRTSPGLYPDPLYPLAGNAPAAPARQWRSLWVTVGLDGDVPSGEQAIRIELSDGEGRALGEETFALNVVDADLPPQTLLHTEWLHADCLATHYDVEPLSAVHWELIERFAETAATHGVNMLLTPIFTPPLDTAVGGERPTVQLVDVERFADGTYRFGFAKLSRWIDIVSRAGIRYFEFAHLFTQWGAKHAPKIVAKTPEGERLIFGWETDAASGEYRTFVASLLTELVRFVRERGLQDRCYLHVSDEPTAEHLEAYRQASAIVREHAGGIPVIDALSDYAFYEQGIVRKPIPSNDHIDVFLEKGVEGLWTYYCCAQSRDVSNRFFNMPSARNRILGLQLYKFKIEGFLHWGYNFWYTQYSRGPVDPFLVTDAGGAFPSGDAFLVYPGADGTPIASIRLEVLREALQDLRALQKLEELAGRESVLELLESGLERELTFKDYPRDAGWLLAAREQINEAIAAHSGPRQ